MWLLGVLVSLLCWVVIAQPAVAQEPTSPANGEQITDTEVRLWWKLAEGRDTSCVQWALKPETTAPGGPFREPEGTDCNIGYRDITYLLEDLGVARYYWHVQTRRYTCFSDDPEPCSAWGPTAYFESVDPPAPTKCNKSAAAYFADNDLVPYAQRKYPDYYEDIAGDAEWFRAPLICKDLTGDGDREMIVHLQCCTGGSLSPWAIYMHDEDGEWRRAHAQIRDTVFRLTLHGRTVRTMLPAPYEGACTRYVRYRSVKWDGEAFRSTRGKRRRLKNPC